MIKFKKRFLQLKTANLPNAKATADKYGFENIIKLNYNENKFGASPLIKSSININSPNIYPEYKSPDTINKLAEIYGMKADNFYVSNGSDAILDYIPTLFASKTKGQNVIVPSLTYGRIAATAIVNDIETKFVDLVDNKISLQETFKAIDDNTSIVYIVNPNMPHGTLNTNKEIMEFMNKIPSHILVVIDEAYAEYAHGVRNSFKFPKKLISKFENVIITRTMSKMFGLASFRVGYMISSSRIVDLFRKTAQVLPVNKYSLQATRAALSDLDWYEEVRDLTIIQRDKFCKILKELDIDYVPSVTNFVLVKIENNKEVREFILKTEGVMVRAVRDFGLRITIGTEEEMKKVSRALSKYKMGGYEQS